MTRSLLALALGLVPTAAALADALIPPPAGKKFVGLDHIITTTKAFPDYDFYLLKGYFATKVEFGPDAPVTIGAKRQRDAFGGTVLFMAVPKGTAGKYPNEQGFAEALRVKTVPGQASAGNIFGAQAAIDAKDPRNALVETHAVEKIDAKAGIVLRPAKGPTPAPKSGDKTAPELSDGPIDFGDGTADRGPALFVPRGGAVVAGFAAALGLAFAGLWLVRRGR
ncbi:MAG TPA: hypothetical protein VH092_36460 [Urbifossiella sp.]|jgi:hypothetical protein|nr:hypothetical protein [Urbifossiella sp.]